MVKELRVVCVEETAHKLVQNLYASHGTAGLIGLVIGQRGEQGEYYVVHIVRTPLLDDDADHAESTSTSGADGDQEVVGDVDRRPAVTHSLKSSSKVTSPKTMPSSTLEKWDVDLVVQHAKQVTRMLLGGFDVLGVFVCTPTEQLSVSTLSTCRQMLFEICKMQTNLPVPSKISSSERLLVHVSCSPNKVSYKTMDVSSNLASPKIIDHKTTSTKWIRLQCRLAINETIYLSREQSASNLAKQIRVGLHPLRTAIEDSIYLIEGQMRNENDPLEAGGSKGRKGNQQQQGSSILNVDFLLNTNIASLKPCLVFKDCNVSMQMRGTIQGRTHVPSKSTVGDAIKSLKFDVLRSLIGRCEIHCEDLLVIDEEQLDRVLVHELPCRIFAPLSSNGDLTVSDFLFPGEQASDSLDALTELLDVSPSAENIEIGCERPTESSDRTPSPSFEHDTGVPVEEMLPPKPLLQSCNYIYLGLSLTVALIAAMTSVYLLQQS